MRHLIKILFLTTCLLGGFLLGACSHTGEGDANLPWSRPADWEHRLTGMEDRPEVQDTTGRTATLKVYPDWRWSLLKRSQDETHHHLRGRQTD